jgi:predicted DCC family thiol-disulfide oxidoreductase YuxK
MNRPVMIWDGDCGFCRRWIIRWKSITGDRVEYVTSQEIGDRFPQIPKTAYEKSVQFVEADGKAYQGAEAVFRSLATKPGMRWPLALYRRLPGFRPASELAYRAVASNRMSASRATRLLWGSEVEPPTFRFARWLFVRAVAAIFVMAFISAWVQIDGLLGPQGILPTDDVLKAISTSYGSGRFLAYPTLCWLGGGGRFLHALCAAGCVFSLAALAGVAIGPCLFAAWACYLSITTVGLDFFSFQWDILLLETGFLAAWYAPPKLRSKLSTDPEPSSLARFLVVFLLFKLMLQSGAVKLLSGDPTWRNLTALRYHYETQPLPTWIGYFMHRLPAAFQKLSTACVFVVELFLPIFVFAPRNLRYLAFAGFVLLQSLILLTGNYCFFNLLALALCLPLLDDAAWSAILRKRLPSPVQPTQAPSGIGWIAAPILLLSSAGLASTFFGWRMWPRPVAVLLSAAAPFRTVNNYGLFAVMTTERDEIIVEGSNDGENWSAYEFKWKPGELKRRPSFVAPHQPRLDWQMWFAALSDYRQNTWFVNFLARLLEGSPPVLGLLEKNPFPNAPPKLIRSTLYRYQFTDLRELRSTGAWWRRDEKGPYTPPIAFK